MDGEERHEIHEISDNRVGVWNVNAVLMCEGCIRDVPITIYAGVGGTVVNCPFCGAPTRVPEGLDFRLRDPEPRNFTSTYKPK